MALMVAVLCVITAVGLASPESSQASTGSLLADMRLKIDQLARRADRAESDRARLEGALRRQSDLTAQAEARWEQDRRRFEQAKEERTALLFRLGAAAVDLNTTYDGVLTLAAIAERARQTAVAAEARAAAALAGAPLADDSGLDVGALGVLTCPVVGEVSFGDSWHAPRHGGRLHEGVDIAAERGTLNVAVQPGVITQGWGHRQGKGITLRGDNGHTYYYFHLSAYEGAPRHVELGEVIGYSGNTGNARGGMTHTHFEIHPGGGAPVNPYPSVAAVC